MDEKPVSLPGWLIACDVLTPICSYVVAAWSPTLLVFALDLLRDKVLFTLDTCPARLLRSFTVLEGGIVSAAVDGIRVGQSVAAQVLSSAMAARISAA